YYLAAKENDIVPKVVIWNLANFANAEPALRVVHTVLLEVAEQIEAREDCTDLARKTASALLEVQHTGTSGYRGDEWLTESSRAVASILARVRSASSLRENRPHICSASVTAADLNVTDNLAVKGSHVEAWLSNYLRLHPTISFGLLEKAFRTAFAAKDDSRQLRALVKARTLKKGEGIREYFVDKLVLLSRYSREMRLADQIAYMKEGLPVSFQKLLIGMSFKSMEEMLDFLVDAEADVADLQERNILPGGSVEKNVSIQESPLTAIEGPTGRVEKLEEAFQALLLAVTEIKGHLGERNSRSRANSRDRRWDRPRSREVSRGNYRGRDQTPGRPRDRSYSRDRESSYDRSRYRRDRSPDRSRRDYSRDSRRDYSRDSRRDYSRDSRRDRSRDYSRDAQKDHSRGAPDRERSRDRDKDSLFRCFSLALYGYQNDFWDVKKQINRHILKNWENFVGLLVDFKGTYFASRSKYMKHTKHQGSVGELPHIIAASEIFDCPVTVVEGKDYTYVGQGRQGKEIVLQTTILNHRPHYDLLECRKFPVRSDFSYAMALGDEPVPDTAKVTPTPVNFTSPNSFGFRTMPPPHTQTTSFPAQTGEGAKPHPSQEKQKNTNTREWHTVTHKSKQHNLNSIMQQINFTTPLQNKFQLLNEHCPADKDIKVTCVKKGSEVCTKIKIIPHKQKPKTHKNQKGSGDILRLTDKGIKDQEILTLHSPRWTSKEHDEEGNGDDEHNIVALLPVTIKTAKVEGLLDTGAVGISYDIILGNNFLKNAKAVLDYGAMLVTLSQKKERLRFRFGVPFRAIKSTTWDCPFQNLNVAEPGGHHFIQVINTGNSETQISPSQNLAVEDGHEHIFYDTCFPFNATTPVEDKSQTVKEFDFDINPNLDSVQMEKAKRLLEEFRDVFVSDVSELGVCRYPEVKIDYDTTKIVRRRNYRMSPDQEKFIENYIQKLLKSDLIEYCTSVYCTPILCVPKFSPDPARPQWRWVQDFRQINKLLKPIDYPVLSPDQIIDNTFGNKFHSVTDNCSGYSQLPLHPDSRDITAFDTPSGSRMRWKVLAQGLSTAPAIYAVAMDHLLMELKKGHKIMNYFDDTHLGSPTFSEHYVLLEQYLQLLRKFKIKLNIKKSTFFQHSVKLLGVQIDGTEIKILEKRVNAIRGMKAPANKDAVRSLLGVFGYNRRFIKNYVHKVAPLQNLMKDGVEFVWGSDQQRAFDQIKADLSNPPALRIFNPRANNRITCDASRVGLGVCYYQQCPNSKRYHPVAFASRKLKPSEKNLPIYYLECAALVYAFVQFHHYLQNINVETEVWTGIS
ncbi:Retrovirus-related Pol polyprotein from transposon 412, partial [Frankliniella fusca]